MTEPTSATLEALIAELGETAARLRAEELEPDDAAALVERCADLAGEVGVELDRLAREAESDLDDGEEAVPRDL